MAITFELGQVVVTWKMNEYAVKNDERILASYPFPQDIQVDGEDKLWIITEWDRSYTTILFPGDY